MAFWGWRLGWPVLCRLFVAVGLLLLFSAFFNFLNLYLGLFRQRIRELRLRIVSGATDRQLIMQMIFELICVIFLALLLAGVITAMVIVVLFTVLGQTLKAANGNPAEVVKME